MKIINYSQEYENLIVKLWNECLIADTISCEQLRKQVLFDENFNRKLALIAIEDKEVVGFILATKRQVPYLDRGLECEQLRKQVLFDENFNRKLALIAIEDKEVVGFILATKRQVPYLDRGLEPERGWINLLFVREDFRKKNIGSEMVKEVEERLKGYGVKNITIAAYSPNYFFPGIDKEYYKESIDFFEKLNYTRTGEAVSMQRNLWDITIAAYSPNYFFPGIDKEYYKESIDFFEKLNYTRTGEAVSMQRNLWDYNIPLKVKGRKNQLEKQGYSFRKFDYKYSMDLLEFLGENFGGGWKRNALMAMQNNEAEKLIWISLDTNDKVVGFCMRKMDGNECRFGPNECRFGPFGVREDLRSSGIGGVLFNLMMDDMKQNKLYYLYFLWTHGAGMRFYQKHGVEVYRSYYLYSKKIA